MKTKTFLLLCLFLGIGLTQLSVQKSDQNRKNVVFDSYIVTLRPGVTMDQYVDFLKTKVVSEYDKNFPGSKMTIGCPDSWRKKNQYCFLYSFDSEKEFNKYIRNGTGMSDEPKAAWEKTRQSLEEEGSKYILDRRRVEVEWETWMEDAK
jgi:hypothetical protein